MTTDDNEITPEKVKELLEQITDGAWVGGLPSVHMYSRKQPNMEADSKFIGLSPQIAQAYLAKCEEVENDVIVKAYMAINYTLRTENQQLQAELGAIRDSDARANLRVVELQAIIDKQREITEKLFIDFAKSIENTANSILEHRTLTRIKIPDEEVSYWIDHIKALALTDKEKQK